MKILLHVCIGWFVIFTLTGCIGEEYDFTPPAITLLGEMGYESDELTEANLAWRGPENVPINKEVSDLTDFAKKQPQQFYVTGEKVKLLFDHTDFVERSLQVYLWNDEQKIGLVAANGDITLPQENGEFVLEINLDTDKGKAQYVGRMNISNK
ncbi:hypothetical protein MHI18_15195 [Peribacillus sp. FSL H8-0477]|uniref:hypothetical protein n=1 Tax=Peribacillus sp. FSL H8-0477 TaxID=2921388 RepID=UPI0030F75CB7